MYACNMTKRMAALWLQFYLISSFCRFWLTMKQKQVANSLLNVLAIY